MKELSKVKPGDEYPVACSKQINTGIYDNDKGSSERNSGGKPVNTIHNTYLYKLQKLIMFVESSGRSINVIV